jgi:hypothetical protein
MSDDDWRVKVTTGDEDQARTLFQALHRGEVAHELGGGLDGRVVVSIDGRELFLYAGTRAQAEAASAAVKSDASQRGWTPTTVLNRWHPASEEWEDADAPLPSDAASEAAEHAELVTEERVESNEAGFPEWEVRVTCASHADTLTLAHALGEQGMPYIRRWRYLLVGANDEDAAGELSKRIGALAPAGSTVTVEQTMGVVLQEAPGNPFAVFGGLGV